MPTRKTKLSDDISAQQQQLADKIRTNILQQGGVIRFGEFMQMALYTPRLGYYQNGLQKFGATGDFVTAPELGNLFARGIANSLLKNTQNRGDILEIGAGAGSLAVDMLTRLSQIDQAPEHYFILEPSAYLRAEQAALLKLKAPALYQRVIWLDDLPIDFRGVIIANEVIDAIPFERIQRVDDQWRYLGVAWENESFVWQHSEVVEPVLLPEQLRSDSASSTDCSEFIEGYTTEIRPLIEPWIKRLGECLQSGSIVLFDYGYPGSEFYHPQRIVGSLQCFSNHTANDNPLQLVGLQDVTAHVDFTQVATAAVNNALSVEGFTTQSGFLLENGILETAKSDGVESYQFSHQVQKLTAPGQMGELIKVMLLQKGSHDMLGGFSLQDHLHRL